MKQIVRRVAALVIGLGLGASALAGLETVTHISDLNASWPLGSDLASTSDDHIRNIKTALKNDFPNVNGAVNPTPTQFNQLTSNTFTSGLTVSTGNISVSAGSATAQSFIPSSSTVPTNGLYLPSANTIGWSTNTTARGTINSTGNWTVNAPSSGSALSVTGVGSSYSGLFTAGGSAGNQKGISAVTTTQNAADRIINVNNSLSNLFDVFGDGHGDLGPNISWTSAGNLTIAAPTSGTALAITGVGAAYTASLAGASSQAAHFALIDGNTGNRPWELRVGQIGTGIFDIFDGTASASRLQINTSGTITGLGSVSGSQVDMSPDTGTFTATYTGFTATITCTATWSRIGKLVSLFFCTATGTSNATSFTMTGLPSAIQPGSLTQTMALPIGPIQNASIIDTTVSVTVTTGSGTVTFLHNGNSSGWTNSGTKGFSSGATISYLLN